VTPIIEELRAILANPKKVLDIIRKELLALKVRTSESTAAWRAVTEDLNRRDVTAPVLAVIDGNDRCVTTHTHEACWPKVNSYGRTVAPGVYFAVIRFEATEGTRDVCQTIKKILIP